MSGFKTALVMQKVAGHEYQLTMPLVYQLDDRITFVVPAGFKTDLASIPRALYISVPPIGEYDQAAVLHDYLYQTQPCSRSQADGIFKQAMQDSGVGWYTRGKMWLAVRLFGGSIWERHAREKDDEAA